MSGQVDGVSRRGLFKRGLFGAALLSVGGGATLALRAGRDDLEIPEELDALTSSSYPVLFSVAEAVLPSAGAAARVTLAVDRSLSYATPRARRDLNQALGLLENGLIGFFTRGSGRPFSRLSIEERRAALTAWRDHSTLLRSAAQVLRRLPLAAYYAEEAAAQAIGYPGPPFEKPPAPLISARAPLSPPFQGAAPHE
ncbi:MAG: hypothetical protein VYD19_01740 [Myxococcota bacterium]|nr:hypothetical protein [Myxococcota bacterium]